MRVGMHMYRMKYVLKFDESSFGVDEKEMK